MVYPFHFGIKHTGETSANQRGRRRPTAGEHKSHRNVSSLRGAERRRAAQPRWAALGRRRAPGGTPRPLRGFLLALLPDQRLVDVGDDASPRYGGFDEGIQLFVAADRQLQMAGSDALHLQVLGGVACQLQDLSSEILEDGSAVHGGGGPDPPMARGARLQVPMDAAHGELQSGSLRARHRLRLGLPAVLPSLPTCHGAAAARAPVPESAARTASGAQIQRSFHRCCHYEPETRQPYRQKCVLQS